MGAKTDRSGGQEREYSRPFPHDALLAGRAGPIILDRVIATTSPARASPGAAGYRPPMIRRPRLPATPAFADPVGRRWPPGMAPDLANRAHLPLDVGENGSVAVSLQSVVDEGAQDHLETHRTSELRHRLPGEHASPVQDLLGKNEKDPGLVLEHRGSALGHHVI